MSKRTNIREGKGGRFISKEQAATLDKEQYVTETVQDISVEKAVQVLTKALREDKDFYFAYQSNIAMAFVDESTATPNDRTLHEIANDAAKRFLNQWLYQAGIE